MTENEKKVLLRLLEYDIKKYGTEEEIAEFNKIARKGWGALAKYNRKKQDYIIGLTLNFIKHCEEKDYEQEGC